MKPISSPDLDAPGFGSAYDPVLNGVASGLTRLFPPVENAPRAEDEEAEAREESDADDRQP